jgi:SM-20-related protein
MSKLGSVASPNYIRKEVFVIYFRAMNEWMKDFELKGWAELKNFLTPELSNQLMQEMDDLKSEQRFRQASIGKDNSKQVNLSQRGDSISWIDQKNPLPFADEYLKKLEQIISLINQHFYLGIRDYECHYAHYPVGSFYKRHTDRHAKGSARRVSSVFYLNPNWKESEGGELVIYEANGETSRIKPEMGTLALFLSELEHEVLPTLRERKSITGWMLTETIL